MHRIIVCVALAVLLVASRGHAQVVCNDPDDLCTGDPCIVDDVEVASPCTLDFGARMLLIRGRIRVGDNGSLDLSAAAIGIEKAGGIDGRHTALYEFGADVALRASGSLDLRGRIDVSGDRGGGNVTLEAGGALLVAGRVRSNERVGGVASGGGRIALGGANGVSIDAIVEAKGNIAGRIDVSSASGTVAVNRQLRASAVGLGTRGGTVTVEGIDVAINDSILATGYHGGTIEISTTGGSVVVQAALQAASRHSEGFGGEVIVHSAGDLGLIGRALVRGSYFGLIELEAAGDVAVGPGAKLEAGTTDGSVRIEGASATVAATIRSGADIRLRVLTGDLDIEGMFEAPIIEAAAIVDLTAGGSFECGPDGCNTMSAGGMLDTTAAHFSKPPVADCPG